MSDLAQHEPMVAEGPRPVAIPRISIQAFCETPEVADVLRSAAADRRLARAHVSVQTGGAAGATEFFASTPTPNLLIVEINSPREEIMQQLGRLAEVCDSGTKVVVIGRLNDVILYRELIHNGISEYVVSPIDELAITEMIADLYNDPGKAPVGRVTAFVGAKGGAGSSTIAHNVAWALSSALEIGTVMLDLDLPFGTANLNFNQDPPQGIADALAAPDRLDDVMLDRLLTKCATHLNLLTAPAIIDRDFSIDEVSVDHLLEVVRQSAPQVIVDVPHTWSPWVRSLLSSADDIVFTAEPTLADLRNAKNMVDLLKAARPNDPLPKLIINQVGVPKRPEIAPKDFCKALELEAVMILPFEPQVFGTAANNGQMIDEIAENSKIAEGFEFLASQIAGHQKTPAGKQSLLGPLLGRLPFMGAKSKGKA